MSVHRFQPRPPIRALVLGAGVGVAGAALAVGLAAGTGRPVWATPGLVLLVLGAALVVLALVTTSRNRAEVELDDEGYVVRNRTGEQRGRWREVKAVKQSVEGDRLTFESADGTAVHVVAPEGGIAALASEVTTRMNRSRGYGRL